ncbi:TadE/TadG family type IV pilus assembly protein [Streptomyces sp. NPDC058731]|uniref:TadE/TadG family type IV pilus assembly protein n=1 Tax=Streptomyces sp. NPDC058731 TaxID=3346613 RepID=UPI00367E9370
MPTADLAALRTPRAGRRKTRDAGQTAIEYVGLLPVLLLIALLVVQLGLAVFAVQQAGTAARAAARAASHDRFDRSYEEAGRNAMSDWLAQDAAFAPDFRSDEVTVTARVPVPSLIPGLLDRVTASRSATMPVDDR